MYADPVAADEHRVERFATSRHLEKRKRDGRDASEGEQPYRGHHREPDRAVRRPDMRRVVERAARLCTASPSVRGHELGVDGSGME